MSEEIYDVAFFKRLATNDTGRARGHQGGVVMPKSLIEYLPPLNKVPGKPTSDAILHIEMRIDDEHAADGTTRFQLQTWSEKRSPEYRVTGGLGPLRNEAEADDVLVFERKAGTLDQFRLTLVRRTSPIYKNVLQNALKSKGRWGLMPVLDMEGDHVNVGEGLSLIDVLNVREELRKELDSPFRSVISRTRRTSVTRSAVRSRAFMDEIRFVYEHKCAITGIGLRTPEGAPEVNASHIIPVSKNGPDDIRNGIALCRTIHWAFDEGLLAILPDSSIRISAAAKEKECNVYLSQFDGHQATFPKSVSPAKEALDWHTKNVFRR